MDRPGGTVLVIRTRGRCRAGHSTSVRYSAMATEVLNYLPPKRRRGIRWYHWIPATMLALLLAVAGLYAWLHWNDPQFWDL